MKELILNEEQEELFDRCYCDAISILEDFDLEFPSNYKVYVVNKDSSSLHGQCSYKDREIRVRPHMLNVVDENDLTCHLVHEMLHACFPRDGHKGNWKKYANMINDKTCLDVKRTHNYKLKEEIKRNYRIRQIYWTITCPCCNTTWERFTRLTEEKRISYSSDWCSKCGKKASQGKLIIKKM